MKRLEYPDRLIFDAVVDLVRRESCRRMDGGGWTIRGGVGTATAAETVRDLVEGVAVGEVARPVHVEVRAAISDLIDR